MLNQTLLREKLGFNGVIVSDATSMGGLSAWGPRETTIPEVIANGCDVILFPLPGTRPRGAGGALADGRLTQERVDDAVTRLLALKAALGLHRADKRSLAGRLAAIGIGMSADIADRTTRRAPTLVKDTQNPAAHARTLTIASW